VPVGLEARIVRLLVAHPPLAMEVDESAIAAFSYFGQEEAERLAWLVASAQALGPQGGFAAFAQHLKSASEEYDAIIAAILREPEAELEADRLFLRSAIRQVKMDALKQELNQLFASGLSSDEIGARYREITSQQDQLLREAEAELRPR
jgi:DNA primase